MIQPILIRRFLAAIIDYAIIITYGLVLFSVTWILGPPKLGPISGQIVGFASLTLPVFLYFYILEKSKYEGSIGKIITKLVVVKKHELSRKNILLRNVLKLLPWELAHTGVHWLFYYDNMGSPVSNWVWINLFGAQLIAFIYFISVFMYKGKSSLYDQIAQTKVKLIDD